MGSHPSHPAAPQKPVSNNLRTAVKPIDNHIPTVHTPDLNHKTLPGKNDLYHAPTRFSPPLPNTHKFPLHDDTHHSPLRHSPVSHHDTYHPTTVRHHSPTRYSPIPYNHKELPTHRSHSPNDYPVHYQHKPVGNRIIKQPPWDSSPPRYHRKSINPPNQHPAHYSHDHKIGEACPTCHQSLTPRKLPTDIFEATLEKYFPGSYKLDEFVFQTKEVLVPKGFYPHVNTLVCIGLCRDEITSPFEEEIEAMWGEGFICGSLGGMLFCGDTGFAAAHHHAPHDGYFIYYCFTHIGIDHEGALGSVYRTRSGMNEKTTACGALAAFASEIASNRLNLNFDENDIEMSMLKKQIVKKSGISTDPHHPPSLLAVTMAAYETITADLEKHARNDAKNFKSRKYALFTGVQIHGPEGTNYCWLGKSSLLVNGVLSPLPFAKHGRLGQYDHPPKRR